MPDHNSWIPRITILLRNLLASITVMFLKLNLRFSSNIQFPSYIVKNLKYNWRWGGGLKISKFLGRFLLFIILCLNDQGLGNLNACVVNRSWAGLNIFKFLFDFFELNRFQVTIFEIFEAVFTPVEHFINASRCEKKWER